MEIAWFCGRTICVVVEHKQNVRKARYDLEKETCLKALYNWVLELEDYQE